MLVEQAEGTDFRVTCVLLFIYWFLLCLMDYKATYPVCLVPSLFILIFYFDVKFSNTIYRHIVDIYLYNCFFILVLKIKI